PSAWDDAGGEEVDLPMTLPTGLDDDDAAPLPMAFGDMAEDGASDELELPTMSTMEISSLAGLSDQDEEDAAS
ncbi:MAG: hypothetical protein VXW58_18375, partial [Pseudomonadota bacterium]|nr:hypothetical protein [Pseudomonadota bacterium]